VPRSHAVYGCSEGFVKSKKYVIPAAVLNPYFAAGMLAVYVVDGRFSPPKNPEPLPLEPARSTIASASATSTSTFASGNGNRALLPATGVARSYHPAQAN
jgi:hypothetical protein